MCDALGIASKEEEEEEARAREGVDVEHGADAPYYSGTHLLLCADLRVEFALANPGRIHARDVAVRWSRNLKKPKKSLADGAPADKVECKRSDRDLGSVTAWGGRNGRQEESEADDLISS